MKRIFTLTIVILWFTPQVFSQDWVQNTDKLYYLSQNGEKVYLTPDYSALAIYFDDAPTERTVSDFRTMAINKAVSGTKNLSSDDILLMDSRGMIRIKDASSLRTIESETDRSAFIEDYGLDSQSAYDVLPAFNVAGVKSYFTKRVVLGLNRGVDLQSISDELESYGATVDKTLMNGKMIVLEVPVLKNQLSLIHKLDESNFIEWGTPDFKVDLIKYNDPLYQYQWHLNNEGGVDYSGDFALTADVDIDAPEAWAITKGSSDITVAVIDDGLNAHEDFPTLLPGFTPANNGDGTPDFSQDPYHGVPCGGLIFAQHNDIGVMGIAPNVNAFSVNIFAANTTNSDLATAVIWAVDNGADVLSNSWGYGSCTANVPELTSAFEYAATSGRNGLGCVILVASGNDYFNCVSYPANLPSVTAVGAVKGSGVRSEYSNYGADLDIVAPSNEFVLNNAGTQIIGFDSDIVTTDIAGSSGSYSGDYYYQFGGTSAATPIAAGVACLVLSVDATLTKSEVENILYSSAVDYGPSGFDNEYANGMVNAYNAVIAAGGTACDLSAPANLSASNVSDNGFDLSWNAVNGANDYTLTIGGNAITVSGTSYTASGLIAGTTYIVSVGANCSDGGVGTTSNLNVTTTGTAPISCNGTVNSYPYNESFESGDGWTQASGDDGDWYRNSGSTPSSNTGPGSASDGSWYLFLEASTNNSPGQIGNNATAILESPCFDLAAASAATFSFQNHMYGSNVGSLVIEATNNDQSWTELWSLSGSQGNQWNSVDVNLDAYSGGTVKLRIVGTTGNGWSSDIAIDDLSVTTSGAPDTEAPSAPTNLSASNTTQTTTDLGWSASTDNVGVTQYTVYQDGSSIGTTGTTSYAVSGLTASTTYSFTVTASDAVGNESAASNGIDVTTEDEPAPDTEAPSVPTNLSASNTTQTSTDLNWSASTDNVGVTEYTVYQDGSSIGTIATTNYTVSGLDANTTYTFTITASDAAGNESAASAGLDVTTLENTGGGTDVLLESYFETGWDGWTDGGSDAFRYSGSRSYEGSYSIRLRDNTSTSTMTTGAYDLSSYNSVDVEFYFYPNSMENGEDFWLQFYDGSSWNTVAAWASGTSFSNNSFYTATVTISSADYNFASNSQFRFRNDASANNDRIYIDQVTISATSGASASTQSIVNLGAPMGAMADFGNELDIEGDFLIYPNPVSTSLNIVLGDPGVPMTYRIVNIIGQTIMQGDVDSSQISVSGLSKGMYIIELNDGEETMSQKFIKQ